jgi:hypothetical protein
VLDPDDERFETYLKQFRPLMPDEFPVNQIKPAPRPHSDLVIWAVGAAVATAILGVVTVQVLNHRVTGESNHSAKVTLLAPTPLTMRRADALLATAPSYKAVMNELAFPPKSSTVPKDKQSALAILGKEKIKL